MTRSGCGSGGVALVIALVSALLCSCSPPRACTLLAAVPGVGVQIEPDTAEDLSAAFLRICDAATCRDFELTLREEYSNDLAEGGRLQASVSTPLTDSPATFVVTLVRAGGEQSYDLTTKPNMVNPNGEGCGGGALRLELVVDDELRVA